MGNSVKNVVRVAAAVSTGGISEVAYAGYKSATKKPGSISASESELVAEKEKNATIGKTMKKQASLLNEEEEENRYLNSLLG